MPKSSVTLPGTLRMRRHREQLRAQGVRVVTLELEDDLIEAIDRLADTSEEGDRCRPSRSKILSKLLREKLGGSMAA